VREYVLCSCCACVGYERAAHAQGDSDRKRVTLTYYNGDSASEEEAGACVCSTTLAATHRTTNANGSPEPQP